MDIKRQDDLKQVMNESYEALDVQREITKTVVDRNKALEKMIGFTRSLKINILEQFVNERELSKGVKEVQKQLENQRRITATLTDESKRAESKAIESSLAQQLTADNKKLAMLQKINSAAIAPMLYFLTKTEALFKDLDNAAAKFRLTMGFTRSSAKDIRDMAEKTTINFMHLGVTIEGAYSSVLALSKEMGSAFSISQDLVKTTSILHAQLGVSEEATAGFLRNMAAIGGTTMQAQQSMAYMAGDLSNAAGVPLDVVMKDVATRSTTTLTMMSRIPAQVVKSAVELRRMGTDLDKATKSGREILNFTENINAEMEASVLLGKSINLQRARELAYHRDIVGSTREILRISKNINFEGLDVFQQEAFARATGKSVDELMAMVQAEKQLDAARKDPRLAGRVEAYEKLKASNEANARASAKNFETQLMVLSNQARLVAISEKWNQILAQAGQAFLPVLDTALALVIPIMDVARGIAGWITMFKSLEFIGKMGEWIANFGMGFEKLAGFAKFFGIFGRVFGTIASIGSKVMGIFGPVIRIASIFGKWVPVLGWIITAVQFVVNLFQRMHGIGEAFHKGILNGIVFGLKAVGLALYDTLLKPFVDVWHWISAHFLGHSPSQLGLSLVKGIMSIQGMLFDALTYPWRHFLAWVLDKIPGMGKVAQSLRGGVGGVIGKSIETQTANAAGPQAVVTPVATTVPGAAEKQPNKAEAATTVQTTSDNTDRLLQSIIDGINNLNKNLESGKIGIYMDGQLMTATLARQTEFRGGFGTNKV